MKNQIKLGRPVAEKIQGLLDQNNQAMNKTQFLHEPQSDCLTKAWENLLLSILHDR